ncbi:MAG: hypothetical protein ACO25F_10135 [Erythrobacter sp.]
MFVAGALASALAFSASSALAQDAGQNPPQPASPPAASPPPAGSVGGMGDVNLFPKRVVLNGRREIASIGLYNKTANDGDYEIKIVDMAMTPEGQLQFFDNGLDEATKARVKTASAMLRHSPRRVLLRGSESQLVRVMARGEAELPDGEYRSHFLVSSVPQASDGLSIDNAVSGDQAPGIAVTIRPRFGIAIPVIVRIGETTLDVGIKNASMVTAPDGSKAVAFTLTRAGTRSAFGDVTVTAQGASAPVAISKGIGVYPEVDSRQVLVPFDPEADPRFLSSGTRLRIQFVDDDFAPGTKLAEHEFVVP